MKIQVTACDKDGEVPALTYNIKVSDGREISVDLCARHAAKIEELIAELPEKEVQEGEEPATDSTPEPEPEPVEQAPAAATIAATAPARKAPARKAAPAKKAAAKKTAAKKTTGGRRRPKVVSFEEIEAQKKRD
ncbi:hypothetical protein [Streptomyces sp. NPDC002611]